MLEVVVFASLFDFCEFASRISNSMVWMRVMNEEIDVG